MYPRLLQKKLLKSAKNHPIVTITGPRQSGKSTLIKNTFSIKPYVNLESSKELEFALNDPVAFLNQFPEGAVLDEIQKAPGLLSDIQVIVDDAKQHGMFILSGSENLLLSNKIAQSLAGRSIILKLLPLSLAETAPFPLNPATIDEYLYTGFYPRIYNDCLNPTETYGSYVETYIERDVRNLLNVKNLSQFRKFIELCAGRIGQLLNKASLASEVGISQSTVEEWISILEATFVCFRLQPWHSNIGKRLVKSPKLFFYDVGLASYLVGINDLSQVARHPLRGNLFENMQINELQKFLFNLNKHNRIYFYRDSHGNEVDLIIQNGDQLIPVEIKSSQTFHSSFSNSLKKLKNIGLNTANSAIIMGSDENQDRSEFNVIGWNYFSSFLNKHL